LLLRQRAYLALRRRPNCQPIKGENNDSECIPTCNRRTRNPNMAARGKEYRYPGYESQHDALPRVWAAHKVHDAHV
jgi:hypothetical protein